MTAVEPRPSDTTRRTPKGLLLGGLLVAFLLAGFVSGYASSSPDGLEKVAGDQGFLDSSRDHAFSGFFLSDYAVKGIDDPRLAGGLAGIIGVAATLAFGTLLFYAVSRLGRRTSAS
jgi:hypothetical protein